MAKQDIIRLTKKQEDLGKKTSTRFHSGNRDRKVLLQIGILIFLQGMVKNKIQLSLFQAVLFFIALIPSITYSQSSDQKKVFSQAETYFLYEDYEPAVKLYQLLAMPDNYNIKYKIGTCYLNMPGEKEKSIPYLEDAVKKVSVDAKTGSFNETNAPIDAYFFLAKAYMINNQPEKGLITLQSLKQITKDIKSAKGVRNSEYIDQQIEACNNLISFRQTPVDFKKEVVENIFRHGTSDFNPAVSFDGKTLVYTEKNEGKNIILMSKKGEDGKWKPAVDITAQLRAGDDCSSSSLNYDGTELFLYKTGNFDGSIVSSKLVNGKWTLIESLDNKINTKYYESHAAISADGKRLYFTSNRAGGFGNLDIYVSERDASGSWGTAVNLGPSINTPFNEDTPFITQNDSILYFCSEGHKTFGGYDVFKSTRKGTDWDEPVNLGFPFNTPDDDKFFQPANNGDNAYYSYVSDSGKEELFYFTFAKPVKAAAAEEVKTEAVAALKPVVDEEKKAIAPTPDKIPPLEAVSNPNKLSLVDPSENVKDSETLFYTVQLIALYNPVDVSYFKDVSDVKVLYNNKDKFYRYTTGKFVTREEADSLKFELIRKGYPNDLFVKKVIKQ
jgi:hypothetical protein